MTASPPWRRAYTAPASTKLQLDSMCRRRSETGRVRRSTHRQWASVEVARLEDLTDFRGPLVAPTLGIPAPTATVCRWMVVSSAVPWVKKPRASAARRKGCSAASVHSHSTRRSDERSYSIATGQAPAELQDHTPLLGLGRPGSHAPPPSPGRAPHARRGPSRTSAHPHLSANSEDRSRYVRHDDAITIHPEESACSSWTARMYAR